MEKNQTDLWFAFVRAHRLMIREVESRLAAAKLPAYAWYDVLWGLESGQGGTRRMHELADALAIERYNLTRLVDRLEKEGLVERTRSPEDGRAAYATITKEGRALRKKMWKVYESAVAELFLSQFSTDEQSTFSDTLNQVAAAARAQKALR
ncbi:MarR family transcriptional regulator [Kosakonia sp. SMBL-WEM22]|uniref:MarR family winged helix-turn-helix transcriptional regulator n=1 Tax=Kosakonia sp. SMBL-WEM22 TaxID=2725560 RepID=UPI0016595CB7|nr:MarR family transcriptional regulator [Kosakonia sp. SMBL-WEM22]MDV5356867.1 MarR family transcriptional regulator [Enterobacter asburiae]QNQ20541.1 MarR family transcriptional regulator [Kosakonia sp. SMBL-WEM22]